MCLFLVSEKMRNKHGLGLDNLIGNTRSLGDLEDDEV